MNTTDWTTILGPLQPLFTDRSITEIMVDAPDRIYVEQRGKLEETGITEDALNRLEAMCLRANLGNNP